MASDVCAVKIIQGQILSSGKLSSLHWSQWSYDILHQLRIWPIVFNMSFTFYVKLVSQKVDISLKGCFTNYLTQDFTTYINFFALWRYTYTCLIMSITDGSTDIMTDHWCTGLQLLWSQWSCKLLIPAVYLVNSYTHWKMLWRQASAYVQ